MMRVDLLRSLPASAESPEPPKAPSGGPLKPVLITLLLLLVAGTLTIWFAKPEWMKLDRAAGLWRGSNPAQADSLRRAEAVAERASRVVEQRQSAALEWLHQLEPLLPEPAGARPEAPVVMRNATFTGAGEFLLEGAAVSAEALSALQEAMVLVPGLDLRESRALEIAGSVGPRFDFRFEGRIDPAGEGETDSAAASLPVRNRVLDEAALAAHLDTLVRAAAERGVLFAPAKPVAVKRSGGLNLHAWKLKGVWSAAAAGGQDAKAGDVKPAATSLLSAMRDVLELERHRGSPFAVQRITLSEQPDQKAVFLDILALTP